MSAVDRGADQIEISSSWPLKTTCVVEPPMRSEPRVTVESAAENVLAEALNVPPFRKNVVDDALCAKQTKLQAPGDGARLDRAQGPPQWSMNSAFWFCDPQLSIGFTVATSQRSPAPVHPTTKTG